ncbi:MAG: hypothetical protein F9K24_13415 [Leptonema illini]|uniref:Uncharacterized protein n=1 Tax=Leptonema illini TaxID=183 RepID=A0A833H0M3_9LEPT|nr:MAG: hypothetical protein F9K24_13415 [Leptonema illini]
MFPAVYEKTNGALFIRYKQRGRIIGIALVVLGSFLLPLGVLMLLSSNWLDKLSWMVLGFGSITEAGGMLLILGGRFQPAGFQIDRSIFRILEKKGPPLTLPLSFFKECGIRSSGRRRRGPFYVYLRGPAGLDFDISSYGSQEKAIADLQLLCSVSGFTPPAEPSSPEERLRITHAVPELLDELRPDQAGDLKGVIQRLKAEGRIVLSPDRRTVRFKDPAARKHSSLSVLFLLFIASMAITAFAEGIPILAAVFVFPVLILIAGWITFSTIRSLFFDEGLSVISGRFIKRRFSVFRSDIASSTAGSASVSSSNLAASSKGDRNHTPILVFSPHVGVPAVGYFGDDYRALVRNITLNPVQLMDLALKRFFAFPHRLYGFTLSESVALYSVIREVFSHGR